MLPALNLPTQTKNENNRKVVFKDDPKKLFIPSQCVSVPWNLYAVEKVCEYRSYIIELPVLCRCISGPASAASPNPDPDHSDPSALRY